MNNTTAFDFWKTPLNFMENLEIILEVVLTKLKLPNHIKNTPRKVWGTENLEQNSKGLYIKWYINVIYQYNCTIIESYIRGAWILLISLFTTKMSIKEDCFVRQFYRIFISLLYKKTQSFIM